MAPPLPRLAIGLKEGVLAVMSGGEELSVAEIIRRARLVCRPTGRWTEDSPSTPGRDSFEHNLRSALRALKTSGLIVHTRHGHYRLATEQERASEADEEGVAEYRDGINQALVALELVREQLLMLLPDEDGS